jgi:VanZ family protein
MTSSRSSTAPLPRSSSTGEQLRRCVPVVVWAAVVSTFSTSWFTGDRTGFYIIPVLATLFPSASADELRNMHQGIRKLAHFTEYLILSVLLYRALRARRRFDLRAAGMALGIAALYSAGDEFHQWFVPGRTAAATDCLIDVSGAAAGQGLLAAWGTRR